MEFKWQALYDRKRHCSTLIWPQGAKWKFRILTAHLQDMPNHILEYQLSTPENVDVVQETNFAKKKEKKKKRRFSTLVWPLGIKWKFRNIIAHLQDIPNHIPEYHLSILWNVDIVPVITTSPKTSFLALNWPLGQKWKILKPYCASARHAQSDPRLWFGYHFRYRRSSSDKKFFGRTGVTTIYPNIL